MMPAFSVALPGQVLFGRGEATKAPALTRSFGEKVLVVHGRDAARVGWLLAELAGSEIRTMRCAAEPTLAMIEAALGELAGFRPDVVVGIGGGAVLDMAKALAALIPAPGGPMDHLNFLT